MRLFRSLRQITLAGNHGLQNNNCSVCLKLSSNKIEISKSDHGPLGGLSGPFGRTLSSCSLNSLTLIVLIAYTQNRNFRQDAILSVNGFTLIFGR